MVNTLSEEVLKKANENALCVGSRMSEEKMREFEIVEVSLIKYKAHLNYMTQR